MRELLSRILHLAGLIVGVAFLCGTPARAQQYNGKELVKTTLIADVSSIQPGQKFRLGVLYRIEPGWHIYWKYSGDSGIPTKIEWQLPEGFRIQDLQWPLPLRDKEPGDLEVFDYTSEVLLFADVQAPASFAARTGYDPGKVGLAGLPESVRSGAFAAFSHFEHRCEHRVGLGSDL